MKIKFSAEANTKINSLLDSSVRWNDDSSQCKGSMISINLSLSSRLFFYCLVALFFSASHSAIAGQVQMAMRSRPVEVKSSFNRILELHLNSSDETTHSSTFQAGLERTLTALKPSLIMGLFHVTDKAPLSTSQIALFQEVQKKVMLKNPRCKFSVTIDVNNYLAAPELLAKLQEITTKLKPDMMNMAVSSNDEVLAPAALARAIEYAHLHGALVTYEGPASMIPDGIDGFVMKAVNGEVHRDVVNNFKIKHHLPIIVRPSFGGYGQDQKEALLLSRLAEEQAPFGFHLAYPLQLELLGKMNENKDPSSLVMLRALMTRYN